MKYICMDRRNSGGSGQERAQKYSIARTIFFLIIKTTKLFVHFRNVINLNFQIGNFRIFIIFNVIY